MGFVKRFALPYPFFTQNFFGENMRIKVCFIITKFKNLGPCNVVANIINNLDRTIFEPFLVTLYGDNDLRMLQGLRMETDHIIDLAFQSKISCVLNAHKRIEMLIDEYGIEIIHSHNFIPDLIASKVRRPIKKIATVHNNMFEDYKYQFGILFGFTLAKAHLCVLRKINHPSCLMKTGTDNFMRMIERSLCGRV